jgi:long-chain acyl-CoA synthetase
MGNQPLTGLPQIQAIPNDDPDETSILRHPNWNKLDNSEMRTLYESFTNSVTKYPTNKCLGWRPKKEAPFEWMSYKDLQERSLDFGSGLKARGMNSVRF